MKSLTTTHDRINTGAAFYRHPKREVVEKRARVRALLDEPGSAVLSLRQIARATNTSHELVRKVLHDRPRRQEPTKPATEPIEPADEPTESRDQRLARRLRELRREIEAIEEELAVNVYSYSD